MLKNITFLLLFINFFLQGCNPCRSLSEKICNCKVSKEEQMACKEALNLSEGHKNFEKAHDEKSCLEALEKCSCEKLNQGQDEECGFYR